MQNSPKLIYKSLKTNHPTEFPAFFYGMPDNHVYVIYSRPYNTPKGRLHHEYIIALLEDFSYDYDEEILIQIVKGEKKPLFLESFVDKYNQKMKVIKTFRKAEDIFSSVLLTEFLLKKCIKLVPPEPVHV